MNKYKTKNKYKLEKKDHSQLTMVELSYSELNLLCFSHFQTPF